MFFNTFLNSIIYYPSASVQIFDLVPSSFVSIDSWCTFSSTQDIYTIVPVTQANAIFVFQPGIPITFTITPFVATAICGTSTPTYSYGGMQLDTTSLPSFMSVSLTTGAISISSQGIIGNYTVLVYGMLSNSQTDSALFTIYANSPPTFISTPSDVSVSVGKTQTTVLSSVIDQDLFTAT